MAAKHNITVAIEPGLLKKARAIAARRGRSVSALLADELRELVAEDAAYTAARKREFALFTVPLPLGGAPHVLRALKSFCEVAPLHGFYDYEIVEQALTAPVAWLLINTLSHADMIERGTSKVLTAKR